VVWWVEVLCGCTGRRYGGCSLARARALVAIKLGEVVEAAALLADRCFLPSSMAPCRPSRGPGGWGGGLVREARQGAAPGAFGLVECPNHHTTTGAGEAPHPLRPCAAPQGGRSRFCSAGGILLEAGQVGVAAVDLAHKSAAAFATQPEAARSRPRLRRTSLAPALRCGASVPPTPTAALPWRGRRARPSAAGLAGPRHRRGPPPPAGRAAARGGRGWPPTPCSAEAPPRSSCDAGPACDARICFSLEGAARSAKLSQFQSWRATLARQPLLAVWGQTPAQGPAALATR